MNPWIEGLAVWAAAAAMMTAAWEWQRRRRNAGIVDVLWAAGLGGAAVLLALVGSGAPMTRAALGLLGGGWGARLARHLWLRVRGEPEDGRYRHLRSQWGDDPWRWFGFFQLQAFVVALFSLPFIAVAANPVTHARWLAVGAGIGLLAVLGEALADAELAAFRADPRHRGRTCQRGLWRISRHPNYFFEWLHWFAYVALAVGSPLWALAWLGPAVMFLFLRYLSGIPWTEAQALRTRSDYAEYQRRTSMLIPWFPKPLNTVATQPLTGELATDRPAPGLLGLAERGMLPDALLRHGIRRLCARRLAEERRGGLAAQSARAERLIEELRRSPIAIHTAAANAQHYELPAAFFEQCLGPRLKYSCALYPRGDETLAEAEDAMLRAVEERALLADGQSILELGCGWGSLTLWMAERFPRSRVTAVSNSHGQRAHIEAACRTRGLTNVQVITTDVNSLALDPESFDRCVSVEMFEHLRNHASLMERICAWLRPGGKLFVHVFAHRTLCYPFETAGEDNWMGRHFFTGGLMPAADTLLRFQERLHLEQRWLLDGTHYQRTANQWLERQDANADAVRAVLRRAYGEHADLWFQRWRMFWIACAELFGYARGQEWLVAHYRFTRSAPDLA